MAKNTKELVSKKYAKRSFGAEIWHRLKKNKGAVVGMVIILLITVIAISAPYVFNYETDVIQQDLVNKLQKPSAEHWFGTDELGRDLFARVLYGSRYSLAVGVVAVLVAIVIGVTLGCVAGFTGGAVSEIIMRVMDIFSSIPSILMAIAIVSAFGANTFNLMLAVGITSTPQFVRITRAAIMTVRSEDYVESSRALGMPNWKIVIFHMLPNCISPILVQATQRIAGAIISAASLSFLGLGVPAPAPEWGAMLSVGRTYIRDYSYLTLFPGLAIMITVLSFNLVGDGLRDAIDPKLKK